jgi:hypothetical protein
MGARFATQPNSRRRAPRVAEYWPWSRLRLPVAPGVAGSRSIIFGSVPLGALRETCGDTRFFDVGRVRLAGRIRYAQPRASSTNARVLRSQKLTLDSTTKQCVMTQELRASRGLTLDATLGQCVTPKSAPQLPPQVVQVQPPPAAPVHSQQGQRAAPLVQIESDATINPELKRDVAQMDELAHFVRASGYRCDSISALRPLPTSNGFKLACNHSTYKYEIEDKAAPS